MGEQIDFPKNFSMYMSQVMTNLQEGNIVHAIDCMKKAYAIKEDDSLNILMVSSLLQVEEYEEALLLAESKHKFYEADEKRLLIYIEILIENNQMLKAEKYLNDQLADQNTQYLDSWLRLENKLNLRKEMQKKATQKEQEKIFRQLYSLPSLNTLEQFSKMKDVYQLSNSHLIKLSEQLLVNPYLHPLVRATLFSLLTEREIDKPLKYLWFGEMKTINPLNMLSIDKKPTTIILFKELEEVLSKNPSLYELAENELNTLLLMLYPFEEEIVYSGSENEWIEAVIKVINPSDTTQLNEDNTKQISINNWVNKIHDELLRFEAQ
ncbi:MAG: hypothetical protein ACTHVM_00250 [Alkalibacterium gilvum]|uniref:Tetratricopeptide repeat-containing protein n=2 Tax=Alkalibacterium gilvum TaxID=1130080 RepID=A0A1H6RBM4_9LACT|nr:MULTISPECIES: hypothetical protein [Alkalibacterium]MDN6194537.1 hypothetical protein [Alkalibacterium sp.]MDN6293114.1 hypothetical protein [Alkalibacterium sp.]MDN6294773.1 hypothetical protein [Alkalibacterium sp.]MDN6397557.1 hypothetical protein [Alkalibacterium sp.]MDN6728559.1 hypothetical protein [Alkalibacterium sp.]